MSAYMTRFDRVLSRTLVLLVLLGVILLVALTGVRLWHEVNPAPTPVKIYMCDQTGCNEGSPT